MQNGVPTLGEMKSKCWPPHLHDTGFEGVVDEFRASKKQLDWQLYGATSAGKQNVPRSGDVVGTAEEEKSKPLAKELKVSSYSGQIGNLDARFELEWLPNNEVKGFYWHPARNPSIKYKLHGSNIQEGEVMLTEYTNGHITANISLLKSAKDGKTIWSGTMENTDGRKLGVSMSKEP